MAAGLMQPRSSHGFFLPPTFKHTLCSSNVLDLLAYRFYLHYIPQSYLSANFWRVCHDTPDLHYFLGVKVSTMAFCDGFLVFFCSSVRGCLLLFPAGFLMYAEKYSLLLQLIVERAIFIASSWNWIDFLVKNSLCNCCHKFFRRFSNLMFSG